MEGDTVSTNDNDDAPGQAGASAEDSAEIQATTFVIDGRPMSFDQMVKYREHKDAAAEAEKQEHLALARRQLEQDAAERAAGA